MSHTKRIESIDGWRAIACLGVLYGHVLGTLDTPSAIVAGVDWFKVFNLWGSGVHLFFVISGLCFYLVLEKVARIDWAGSVRFWKKRWWRIAPAYYTAAVVYGLYHYGGWSNELAPKLLTNFLFIHPYIPGMEIAALFWSLSVEWIFYLVLPLLFLFIHRIGLVRVALLVVLSGTAINLLHYGGVFGNPVKGWYYLFPANYAHFGWGILIGYWFKENRMRYRIFNSWGGLLLGLVVAYVGKLFFFSGVVKAAGSLGWLVQGIGPIVMTAGFSIMILNSLRHARIAQVIGNRAFSFVGRISYSFYLWHVLILGELHYRLYAFIPENALGVLWLFGLSLLVIIPISWMSYTWLESFYFQRKSKTV